MSLSREAYIDQHKRSEEEPGLAKLVLFLRSIQGTVTAPFSWIVQTVEAYKVVKAAEKAREKRMLLAAEIKAEVRAKLELYLLGDQNNYGEAQGKITTLVRKIGQIHYSEILLTSDKPVEIGCDEITVYFDLVNTLAQEVIEVAVRVPLEFDATTVYLRETGVRTNGLSSSVLAQRDPNDGAISRIFSRGEAFDWSRAQFFIAERGMYLLDGTRIGDA